MPITGELVRLRELREEDYPLMVSLRNDLETQAWSRTLPPDYTVGMYRKRFDERTFEYRRESAHFIVEDIFGGNRLGFCTYSDVRDRFDCSIGIAMVKESWGTGASHEAGDLLLRFLFEELGMRVVRLWTHGGNPRAVASARKLGFHESVRLREGIFKGGSYHDNLAMDLLREEWYALHPELTDRLEPL